MSRVITSVGVVSIWGQPVPAFQNQIAVMSGDAVVAIVKPPKTGKRFSVLNGKLTPNERKIVAEKLVKQAA